MTELQKNCPLLSSYTDILTYSLQWNSQQSEVAVFQLCKLIRHCLLLLWMSCSFKVVLLQIFVFLHMNSLPTPSLSVVTGTKLWNLIYHLIRSILSILWCRSGWNSKLVSLNSLTWLSIRLIYVFTWHQSKRASWLVQTWFYIAPAISW